MGCRDLYDVLGVDEDATADAIKAVYRQLARTFHPDVNADGAAVEHFREITEAFVVLSDPGKRRAHDRQRRRRPRPIGEEAEMYLGLRVAGIDLGGLVGVSVVVQRRPLLPDEPGEDPRPQICYAPAGAESAAGKSPVPSPGEFCAHPWSGSANPAGFPCRTDGIQQDTGTNAEGHTPCVGFAPSGGFMRLASSVPGNDVESRNSFVLIVLLAALACAGPAGKEGPQGPAGPPGSPADGGTTTDAGPSAALTTETCTLCHGSGQIADDITLHKAVSANALARNFATITSVNIPSSAPIKPTVVFTVKDAVTSGNPVTGLTSFAFTVAQLDQAATGGISNWRNLINRSYNPLTDTSIGGTTESSLPTAAFPAAAQAACTESPAGTYTCVLGGVAASCTAPACTGDDLAVVQPLNASYGVVNPVAFNPALPTRIGLQSGAPTPGSPASVTTFSSTIWTGVGGIPPPPAKITVQPTPPFTATFDLHTYDTAVTVADPDPRSLVTTAACNQCHQRLTAHGRRLDVNYCVTCHNSSSLDPSLPTAQRNAPDPYNGTVDFKRVLHKVHMGKNLPSVVAGGTFTFHGVDFSDVAFPQMSSNGTSDAGNCTACHTGATGAAADNWKNKPGMVACASCHDGVSFAASATPPPSCNSAVPAPFPCSHSGGPRTDDSQCALCHASGSGIAPVDNGPVVQQ
ncbi:MAG: multiheme c-type cytochrome [Myxococcales bacterium]